MSSNRSLTRSVRRYACLVSATLLIAACASQKDPAQKMIGDIEALVNGGAAEAAEFVPEQLKEVQSKLGELKASYDKEDYKAVVSAAPPVLSAAQALAGAATAKKDEMTKTLTTQWTQFASTLPQNATAVQNRIDFLSKKENRKLASGVDLDAARASLGQATQLWTKAQGAYSAGNLPEAVTTAASTKTSLDALAMSMQMDFKEPAAVRDTSPQG